MATAKYRVRWRWDTLGQSSLQAVLTNPVLSALAHFNFTWTLLELQSSNNKKAPRGVAGWAMHA